MKNFILNCLSSSGKVSSKRVVTILAFILMAIGFISNLYWDHDVDPTMYESMKWIVIGGLGFTASELFSPKRNENQ